MYEAKILADSIAPHGARLTTMEITYPRFVHAEFMTHRMFSRNSASSRAIPIGKMIQRVIDDPVLPVYWGKNQKGMQADKELDEAEKQIAIRNWLMARDNAIQCVNSLLGIGVHKQIANRLLEPWMFITVIVSATEWANFFHLRCHPAAQPEIHKIAEMMKELYDSSIPHHVDFGDYHLPLIHDNDWNQISGLDCASHEKEMMAACKVSVGRCARVSYLTHDGERNLLADVELHDRLLSSGHWSPFEHVATPSDEPDCFYGNFKGWIQYRKKFSNENVQI